MPRRSSARSGSGHSRQQTRQAHTVPQRQPPQQQQQQQQQHAPPPPPPQQQQPYSRSPGLFGTMASTAAGVAIGSSIGHTVGALFTGSSNQQNERVQQQPDQQVQPLPPSSSQQPSTTQANGNCEVDAKAFAKCLEDNTNDISACQWYLDQLKSCRQMAQQY